MKGRKGMGGGKRATGEGYGGEGIRGRGLIRIRGECRADDKTAAEYNLEGGATLHLVLALRGGWGS